MKSFNFTLSHGGLSAGRGVGEKAEKDTGSKKHNWQAQNRQGEVKNSIGNREAKELICMTHEHELRRRGELLEGGGVEGGKGKKKIVTIVIA